MNKKKEKNGEEYWVSLSSQSENIVSAWNYTGLAFLAVDHLMAMDWNAVTHMIKERLHKNLNFETLPLPKYFFVVYVSIDLFR